METFEYDVALSFAGEDRDLARMLALSIEDAGHIVFYDEFDPAALWGTELSVSLADIYSTRSNIHSYFSLAITPRSHGQIMNVVLRFSVLFRPSLTIFCPYASTTQIPGWPTTIAYIDVRRTSLVDIVATILAKLGEPQGARRITVVAEDCALGDDVLRACLRRAIFTRMDSEIHLGAMHSSVAQTISEVQRLWPRFHAPALQHLGARLVRALDDLQRRTPVSGISNHLTQDEKRTLDGLKLEVLQLLRLLKRTIGSSIQFPLCLGYDHFFSPEDALASIPHEDPSTNIGARSSRGRRDNPRSLVAGVSAARPHDQPNASWARGGHISTGYGLCAGIRGSYRRQYERLSFGNKVHRDAAHSRGAHARSLGPGGYLPRCSPISFR